LAIKSIEFFKKGEQAIPLSAKADSILAQYNMKKDIIQTFIAICAIVGIVLGAITYFATAEDVKLIEKRLDLKILWDRYQIKQQRIDLIKDRFEGRKMDKTIAEEIKNLEKEKVSIDQEIKNIEKK